MKLNSSCSSVVAINKAKKAIKNIIETCTTTEKDDSEEEDDLDDDANSCASSNFRSWGQKSDNLQRLVASINKRIVFGEGMADMSEDDVAWVLTLAVDWRDPGDGKYIDSYVTSICQDEATPCLTGPILKQVLAFAMGNEGFMADVIASTLKDADDTFLQCFSSKMPDFEETSPNTTGFSLTLFKTPVIALKPGLFLVI